MNKIYSKLDKIACFGLMAVCIISNIYFIGNANDYKQLIEVKENSLTAAIKSDVNRKDLEPLLSNFKGKTDIDLLEIKRNIFVPFKDDEKRIEIDNPILEVLDISHKPLGFQYQGRITYPDGQIVAQINANKKSYLVKIGAKLAKYRVEHLDKNVISLKSKQGKYLNIKYLQTAFSDELMAKIKDNISGNIETVYKNSSIYGYKVLDIEEDSVTLSKSGQHLRLQKGMVQ